MEKWMLFALFMGGILLSLLSCGQSIGAYASGDGNESLDSLSIVTQDFMPEVYVTNDGVYQNGVLVSLYGYNERNHSIDVVRFSAGNSGVLDRLIKLKHEGAGSIDEVKYVEIVGEDSLLIASRFNISLLDLKREEWLYRFHVPTAWTKNSDDERVQYYEPFLKAKSGRNGKYNKATRKFYFPLTYFGEDQYASSDYFAEEVKLFGAIDFSTNKVALIDIAYPQWFRDNFYGRLGTLYCDFSDDTLYYGFSGYPDIHRYSLTTDGPLDPIEVDFVNYPKAREVVPLQGLGSNIEGATLFTNIFYNPINKRVYRSFTAPYDEKYPNRVYVYLINPAEERYVKLPPAATQYGLLYQADGCLAFQYTREETPTSTYYEVPGL